MPIATTEPDIGLAGGVAWLRVRQPTDSLGTRPTTTVAELALAPDRGWRTALTLDRWSAGNARRLLASAFASETPLVVGGSGLRLQPRRMGADIVPHWRRPSGAWVYLGLGWRRNEGDELPFAFPDWPLPPCDSVFGCPIPLRADPVAADFDIGPSYGLYMREHTTLSASLGRLRDTRDNIFAPQSGRLFDLSVKVLRSRSDWGFVDREVKVRAEWRRYRPLASGGVLALQTQVAVGSELPPVEESVTFGQLGRGFPPGYMPGSALFFTQAEWRSPTRWMSDRLGYALFASFAEASRYESRRDLLLAGGAGLRYRLDRRTRSTLRLDYGWTATSQRGLILALQEAF